MKAAIVAVLALIGATNALFFPAYPDWDGLRTTWSLNPFNKYAFDKMPRNVTDALAAGFELRDDWCANPGSGQFVGARYWIKDNRTHQADPALTLLYDKNGFIAGAQTSLPNSDYKPLGGATAYLTDGDYYTVTVYFVDPAIICTTGRSKDDFSAQGTGNLLYIQNGADPKSTVIKAPMTEDDAKKSDVWKFGACYKTIGNNYWWKTESAPAFTPVGLMFSEDKLTGFSFFVNYNDQSLRYEHWTLEDLDKLMDPVPDFIFETESYRTPSLLHVYFKENVILEDFC